MSRSQDFNVSRFHIFNTSRLSNFIIIRFQDFNISFYHTTFQDSMITQSPYLAAFQNLKIGRSISRFNLADTKSNVTPLGGAYMSLVPHVCPLQGSRVGPLKGSTARRWWWQYREGSGALMYSHNLVDRFTRLPMAMFEQHTGFCKRTGTEFLQKARHAGHCDPPKFNRQRSTKV